MKDYNIDIQYHPRKVNVVADALSGKTAHSSELITREPREHTDFELIGITIEGIKAQ